MQARGVTEEVGGEGPASPSSLWRGGLLFPGQLSKRIESERTPVPRTERPCLCTPLLAVKSPAPERRGMSSVHMAILRPTLKPAGSPTLLLSCWDEMWGSEDKIGAHDAEVLSH